jgi:serine/threonine protein phosphatase 1
MKLFCVSDVHSYLRPLKKALDAAGFDKDNPEHWLISCGDLFDRGPDSEETLYYIMSLERKVLVKGNHDLLLEDCCMREFPYAHDVSNGTVRTINDIGDAGMGYTFDRCCDNTWHKTATYRGMLVNYFETENYIFVHSWIPTITHGSKKPWHTADKYYAWKENWREASAKEWEEAMWGNPFFKAQDGMNKTGKTIVFGHWHCSLGHLISSDGELSEFGDNACWDVYKNDEWKIIGLDKCTAHTGEVNVLVIEDNFLNKEGT